MLQWFRNYIKNKESCKFVRIAVYIAAALVVVSFLPWVVFCVLLAILAVSIMAFVEFQA